MAKPTIVTRAGKGSALTWTEGDANLTNLRDATLSVTDGTNTAVLNLNDTLTFTAGTNITLSVNPTTDVITINNSQTAFNPAAPGAIGGTTAAAGRFTDITATNSVNFQPTNGNVIISPQDGYVTILPFSQGSIDAMTIGQSLPAAGKFTNLQFTNSREPIYNIGTTGGTITPSATNGSVQKITVTSNITLNAFTNPVAGQSLTLILTQGSTAGFTLTSTMKFAGASKTLSTAIGATDIITVFYDGTTYWASLAKGFA
jgi:hypothetical protein